MEEGGTECGCNRNTTCLLLVTMQRRGQSQHRQRSQRRSEAAVRIQVTNEPPSFRSGLYAASGSHDLSNRVRYSRSQSALGRRDGTLRWQRPAQTVEGHRKKTNSSQKTGKPAFHSLSTASKGYKPSVTRAQHAQTEEHLPQTEGNGAGAAFCAPGGSPRPYAPNGRRGGRRQGRTP
jgi:hypothetical protein